MERKKKHSIIWLIIIIVAIVAIVLITIAGARNSDTTAYAAEIKTDNSNISNPQELEGISNISTGQSGNIEPSQTLFFGIKVESSQQGLGRITLTLEEQINPNETYKLEISYITNSKRYWTNTSNATMRIAFLNNTTVDNETTITTNNAGITENTLTVNVSQSVNNIQIDYFYNQNGAAPIGEYWINILKFNLYDSNNNTSVKYQSYLYNYLKTQFDNANSSGYENGLNDGESLYRNNPFNGAVLISATVIKDKYNITDTPLNLLSNGISFNSLKLAAEDHMYGKEEFEGEQGWTVKFSVIPFIFEQNQIYISQSYGFASLIMTDINNNTYNISWGDTLTKLGYALTGSTAYGKTIKQIQITFANIDYVGTLYVGQTAAQDSAYNEGYDKGYNQGHIDGYNQATTDSNGPAWAINKLVSTVSAGLSTDIIGEISIGDILSVMLGILLTFAVIRFFGGG